MTKLKRPFVVKVFDAEGRVIAWKHLLPATETLEALVDSDGTMHGQDADYIGRWVCDVVNIAVGSCGTDTGRFTSATGNIEEL